MTLLDFVVGRKMSNNNSSGRILLNAIQASLGLMLFAFGVYLVIQADIGVAPWDVFCLGLAKQTKWLYGTCSILISVIVLLIDALVLREKIGIGMILDAVIVGRTVDFLNYLNWIPKSEHLWLSLLLLAVGFLLEGYGQFIYIRVGLGTGPRDTLQIGLGRKMPKIPIGVVNMMILTVVFVIGYFLGGPIGIGSLLAPFGVGLMQQLAFSSMHFDPKQVKHQNLLETARVIFRPKKRSVSSEAEKNGEGRV